MTDLQRNALLEAGVEIDEALERCMNNENLYFRCLSKFIEDTNYDKLIQAIESGDAGTAFEASHGLKGVCLNLGLSALCIPVSEIVEVFRNGSLDYRPENFEALKIGYERTINTLKNIL
ncbi:MAG: Hpt domain-containing protein [Lachnospiraceae bacterium]|nr:Hpt domain-containing protein [Lachnospiraceae bacterium]